MPEPGGPEGSSHESINDSGSFKDTLSSDAERFKEGYSSINQIKPTEGAAQNPNKKVSSFIEAYNRLANEENNPELQALTDEMNEAEKDAALQNGATDIIKGYVNWAKITGDQKITSQLLGRIPELVKKFVKRPEKVSETITPWTKEETQEFMNKLEDQGIISKSTKSDTEKADEIIDSIKSPSQSTESSETKEK